MCGQGEESGKWGRYPDGDDLPHLFEVPNISPLKIHCFSLRYRDGDGDHF